LYEFLRIFLISENSLKFANFFAEVTNSRSMLITAFAAFYLLHQQRRNVTSCAREHTTQTYLKELGTSLTQIFLHALCINTRTE